MTFELGNIEDLPCLPPEWGTLLGIGGTPYGFHIFLLAGAEGRSVA